MATNRSASSGQMERNDGICKMMNAKEMSDVFLKKLHSATIGASSTPTDLGRWAKHHSKDVSNYLALEVYDWMEKNKMEFSAFQLEDYVDRTNEREGLLAAYKVFKRVAPDFKGVDMQSNKWPAFHKICLLFDADYEQAGPLLRRAI